MHWLFLPVVMMFINEDIYVHCAGSFVYVVLTVPSARLERPVLCGYTDRRHCVASPNFGFLIYKRDL